MQYIKAVIASEKKVNKYSSSSLNILIIAIKLTIPANIVNQSNIVIIISIFIVLNGY